MYKVVDAKYLYQEDGMDLLVEIPPEDLRGLDETITEALLAETNQSVLLVVRYYPSLTHRTY